ncbi:MAG: phosphate ABC transporter permease PstA, partial [Oligoflexia bacterium]|nr:phosphate ABC transporter permease PstA [Oligoflexia bacterium]
MSFDLAEHMARSYRRRHLISLVARAGLFVAGTLALVPLFWVFGYVVFRGLPGLNLDFFVALPAPVGEPGGGMANALAGTGILAVMASLIGIPWGVLIGTFLSEYGKGRLAGLVRMSVDLLASVPSIVIGLFVYSVVVLPMKRFSALAGAVALGILMVPTVARTTEELLKLIPPNVREAGLALGIPRWKVILGIVLKGSIGPISTGVVLSLARVAGETAPLLFTAFGNQFWHRGLDQPIASLPVQIYTFAISPYEDWHRQAWAGAFVLVAAVLVLNVLTR